MPKVRKRHIIYCNNFSLHLVCSILVEEEHAITTPLESHAEHGGNVRTIPCPEAHAIIGTAPVENMNRGAPGGVVQGVQDITERDVWKHGPEITEKIMHGVIWVCS